MLTHYQPCTFQLSTFCSTTQLTTSHDIVYSTPPLQLAVITAKYQRISFKDPLYAPFSPTAVVATLGQVTYTCTGSLINHHLTSSLQEFCHNMTAVEADAGKALSVVSIASVSPIPLPTQRKQH